MQPNFKIEQILKKGYYFNFLNFFASVNAYGTLWNHFQKNELIHFKNMLKKITKLPNFFFNFLAIF